MRGALIELYRHSTWATLRLLEYCRGLGDERLDATTPGTYGTIRDTLRHLVEAEEGYLRDVTGESLRELMPEGRVPLTDLAERIRRLGPRWEALARDAELQDRDIVTKDGAWRVPAAVPMAQALHHANDHRTHVLSIIGALGLDDPRLSVWRHAIDTGLMREIPPAADG